MTCIPYFRFVEVYRGSGEVAKRSEVYAEHFQDPKNSYLFKSEVAFLTDFVPNAELMFMKCAYTGHLIRQSQDRLFPAG